MALRALRFGQRWRHFPFNVDQDENDENEIDSGYLSKIQIIVILKVIHLPGFQSLKPKKQYTRRVSGLSSHQILSPGDYPDALR